MVQRFDNITTSDRIDLGLLALLDRDLTALTAMSGESDPQSPPTDAVYDNRTSGVLKLNGDVLIDYKNKLLNSTTLASMLQPLNANLTAISSAELDAPCLITTDGEVLGLTDYGVSATNRTDIDGVKTLAKKSVINTALIDNSSITQGKLETPLSETAPFKCGDVLYSCVTRERPGFLRLGKNYTLGSSMSNATYRNDNYFNLYSKLWAKSSAVIRDYSGKVINKASSASEDFSDGNSVDLLFLSDPVQQKFSTKGAYSYTIPWGVTKLDVTCAGAAGGRAKIQYDNSNAWGDRANGALVHCILSVVPGDVIYLYVGGKGGDSESVRSTGEGGWNGGGNGYGIYGFPFATTGGGGGGASDIRVGGRNLSDRKIVAGGAGGSSGEYQLYFLGGAGGGLTGAPGEGPLNPAVHTAAQGGTQSNGGAGSSYGDIHGGNGSFGQGADSSWGGAGGGGGYYGGGSDCMAISGGGGGSSYTDSNLCSDVTHRRGMGSSGDGWITITPLVTGAYLYIKY